MGAELRPRGALRRMRPGLGTFVEIGCAGGPGADAAVEAAYRAVNEIERRLSFQDPDSELSRLNRAAGAAVTMSSTSRRVIVLALALGRASAGRFNCTVGGALVSRRLLPDHGGARTRDAGDDTDVVVSGPTVRLRRGVRLTLDGIAKGYAVDAAVRALERAGADWGWVNAGGDLRAFGGVVVPVHLRDRGGASIPLGGLSNAALATSGSAGGPDRSAPGIVLSADGTRAIPGRWSVVARCAWRADALTKVAALAPPRRRARLLARLGGRLVVPARKRR